MTEIRAATLEDEEALAALDRVNWSTKMSPAPRPLQGKPFFDERHPVGEVRVAEENGRIVGYVRLGKATELRATDHVVHINGLLVDEGARGRGIGKALLSRAIDEARARPARRVTLRMLGHNAEARRLYASLGFEVEGVLRGEFFLDGVYVDDVLMALDLSGES